MPDPANNKTEFFTITLYPAEIEAINLLKNHKKFNFSETIRFIINEYFQRDNKKITKDFVFYLGYPLAFMVISLFASISTERLVNLLLEKSLYFNELYILSRVFLVMSFGSISIFVVSLYLLRRKFTEAKYGA